jgi:predicted NBD/HSP70 family sugar kinase
MNTASWPRLGNAEGRVLLELLLRGSQSRVRLAERVGLSRTSLTRIARDLVDYGLITEGEAQPRQTRGRPPEVLHLRPDAAHFVGAKLTGDALYVVLTDLSARVVNELSAPLPNRNVTDVVALLARVTARITENVELTAAIGVGLAGDITRRDDHVVLERSNFLGWDGVPLADLVESATGLHTTVSNDVHALAAAHHWFGGLGQHRSLIVYGLGAGIGSGVVIDDELVTGAHGRSGRVGHTRIGGRGRQCDNGHVDCVHSFVTMPAIELNAGVAPGEYPEAVRRAHAGDERALDAFRMASFALGAVVAEAVNTIDPEMVSVMGEGLDMLDVAPEELRRAMAEYLEQADPATVRVERPGFHFDLYARGAAVSAMRELLSLN